MRAPDGLVTCPRCGGLLAVCPRNEGVPPGGEAILDLIERESGRRLTHRGHCEHCRADFAVTDGAAWAQVLFVSRKVLVTCPGCSGALVTMRLDEETLSSVPELVRHEIERAKAVGLAETGFTPSHSGACLVCARIFLITAGEIVGEVKREGRE